MDKRILVARIMVFAGFAAIVVGTFDPLEGVFLIAPGSVTLALAAFLGGTRHRRVAYASVALIAAAFVLILGMSGLGGFGGNAPLLHSNWWGLLLLPYPVGWIMGVAGGALVLTSLFNGWWARIVAGGGVLVAALLLGRIASFRLVPLWVAVLVVVLGVVATTLVYRSEKPLS